MPISPTQKSAEGFSLIELIIVITLIGIIAAIAIPNILTVRRKAQEASGAAIMKSVIQAESMYFSSHSNQSYGTLNDLVARNCLDASLLTQQRNYYTFLVNLTSASTYNVTGTPGAAYAAQMRHYYGDETGVIRVETGTAATATSPPLQ